VVMRETNIIEEKVKKSALVAKTIYEYRKLIFPENYLITMTLKEDGEDLDLGYDVTNLRHMSAIRGEDKLAILTVLMSIKSLASGAKEYAFTLNPENLYYDLNHYVLVKERDIYATGRGYDEQEFLNDYKAVIGFALQSRYSYEDYKQGGNKLMDKGPLQMKIYEASNLQELHHALYEEYIKIEEERKKNKVLLNKKMFTGMKIAVCALSVLCLAAAGYLGYRFLKEDPYKNAVIAADNAFIAEDYVACIDAMKNISVEDMDIYQKYILAQSYVRGENLTQEQKNNIQQNITLSQIPEKLEYWIYLGRGDAEKAIDMAMVQGDDQLLLYAYMKQKAATELDTSMSGEEKTQKLSEIDAKMKPLMERYETEEE